MQRWWRDLVRQILVVVVFRVGDSWMVWRGLYKRTVVARSGHDLCGH
uniref:Uncharacterized protein n=1 Tax=Cucumis melo TaxID=3656 RepID=A0A9I9EKS9_CUCME